MRISNINHSIANSIARFVDAGNEMLFAFLPERLRLQHSCAGFPAYPTAVLPGNSGAAIQLQLLKPGVASTAWKLFGRDDSSRYMPTTSVRDWQLPGVTRRQTRWGIG
jgi:hypothetical protein